MKKIYLIIAILTSGFVINAQTIGYNYDDTGNRLSRTIVVGGQKSMILNDENTNSLQEDLKTEESFTDILGELKITIYPNPNQGQMVVQINNISEDVSSSIIVYDLAGKTIYRKQNLVPYTNVDITNSPNGTYILKIKIGKEVSEWKVIKK